MLSTTPTVKIEPGVSSKDEMKTDVAETTKSIKTENAAATEEPHNIRGKTETSDTDIYIRSEDSKIGTSTVTGTSKERKTANDATDTNSKDGNQTHTKNESDSSTVDGDKSVENNNWDNGYSNELQKMYSNVDADTRAVAEEMIRAVQAGNKKNKPHSEITKASSPTLDHTVDKQPPVIAPKPDLAKEVSKSFASDVAQSETNKKSSTVINKKNEPSALELALKQQGITQSDQLRSTQFPFRLHNMLDDAQTSGHYDIVSWCPGGDSFKIHKPTKLINVLQKYFRQSKFKSFLRQLQGYNFKRITRGKDQGVVSHPLFLRGRRSVSTLMRRKRVGPKPDAELAQANKIAAAVAAGNLSFGKKSSMSNDGVASRSSNPSTTARILPQAQHAIARQPSSSIHSAATFLNNAPTSSSQPVRTAVMNPNPQDVLCVDYPNDHQVQQFQGNRKLASIVQKITGHYTSANESVRTMIVNEISSRIQNSGSRFLKLSTDGLSWMECNREEMFRKVIKCFEQEIVSDDKSRIDLTGDSGISITGDETLTNMGNPNLHGVGTSSDSGRRMPPRSQDVVLRGGPGSEREGNNYLKTMIQANVGQQLDSFEMKRIKCRAILERMKRRGSRFFLKLKENDTDDEMYILSDAEAQDVIYTAFCAEENKVQSMVIEVPTATSMLRAKALAGMDTNHAGLSSLGGVPQYASRTSALQSEAALLSRLKTNNDIGLLASQGSLKRPLPGHGQLSHENIIGHLSHDNIIEKRLRAETDEHIKILIERERQRRNDPYNATGLAGRLSFNARNAVLDSSIPFSKAFGSAATSSTIDQYLKDRRADEMLLNSVAAARAPFSAGPPPGILAAELPKSNNHFVEFLKKKYVKSAQERAW